MDTHFCYNCLENIPSNEARLKKYRCGKCFECPCCQHTLSARATTVQVHPSGGNTEVKDESIDGAEATGSTPEPDTKKVERITTRKMYYLSCLACRWTSRDVGLPDQMNGKFLLFFNFKFVFQIYLFIIFSNRQLA